jgi:uncharacterized protein (TIGR03083 family)
VANVTDATPWVRAVRASHDRLAGLVAGLDADGLRAQSYDTEWSIADVLSHLGSGAEIFALYLDAAADGGEPPSREAFPQIWDTWNARSPEEQAARSVEANEALVSRIESLTPEQRAAFQVAMFGPVPMDLAGFLGMRLSEHALHTWDVAVVLDPAARVAPDAVELLIDAVPRMAGFIGKKAPAPVTIAVSTADPERAFTLDTGGVSLTPAGAADQATASLTLPAEAFVRLLSGRLDDASELKASGVTLPELTSVFPGF